VLTEAVSLAPGTPAAGCDQFVRQLSDGSVRYAVTFTQPQAYVEVFVRQNGIQNVAKNIVSSAVVNADGTYTYSYTKPGSTYNAGDRILARFYSYGAGQPGVFTPGPGQSVWAPEFDSPI
jgi:hypothetical protein